MDADPWADTPTPPRGTSAEISREEPVSAQSEISLGTLAIEDQPQSLSSVSSPAVRAPLDPSNLSNATEDENDGFDDFDDFDDAPIAGPSGTGGEAKEGEDAFGDFGDFEEGDFEGAPAEDMDVAPISVPEEQRMVGPFVLGSTAEESSLEPTDNLAGPVPTPLPTHIRPRHSTIPPPVSSARSLFFSIHG